MRFAFHFSVHLFAWVLFVRIIGFGLGLVLVLCVLTGGVSRRMNFLRQVRVRRCPTRRVRKSQLLTPGTPLIWDLFAAGAIVYGIGPLIRNRDLGPG